MSVYFSLETTLGCYIYFAFVHHFRPWRIWKYADPERQAYLLVAKTSRNTKITAISVNSENFIVTKIND
jgi:hypothetical protein